MGTLFYEIRANAAYIGPVCDHPFPLHVHDVVEIVCNISGVQKLTIAGKQHTLTEGSIAVIFTRLLMPVLMVAAALVYFSGCVGYTAFYYQATRTWKKYGGKVA